MKTVPLLITNNESVVITQTLFLHYKLDVMYNIEKDYESKPETRFLKRVNV